MSFYLYSNSIDVLIRRSIDLYKLCVGKEARQLPSEMRRGSCRCSQPATLIRILKKQEVGNRGYKSTLHVAENLMRVKKKAYNYESQKSLHTSSGI